MENMITETTDLTIAETDIECASTDEQISFADPLDDFQVDDDPWGNEWSSGYDDDSDFQFELDNMKLFPEKSHIGVGESRIFVKPGHQPIREKVHRLQRPQDQYPRNYKCNGADCNACRADFKTENRRVEFVWDVANQKMVLMEMAESKKPNSLFQQLCHILKQGFPAFLLVRRPDQYTYDVKKIVPKSSPDVDLNKVQDFLEAIKEDRINLETIFPVLTNEEMMDVPEVAAILSVVEGL